MKMRDEMKMQLNNGGPPHTHKLTNYLQPYSSFHSSLFTPLLGKSGKGKESAHSLYSAQSLT